MRATRASAAAREAAASAPWQLYGGFGYARDVAHPGVLVRLARSLAVRRAYHRLSRIAGVRHTQRWLAGRLLRKGETRWVTLPTGRSAGLKLLADVRTELGYVRGDHEPW